MRLGQKLKRGINKLGHKTSDGLNYLGNKINEYKYNILKGLLTTGLMGYAVYLSSKNPTYQKLIRGNLNPTYPSSPPSYQDALSMEHIAGFRG